MDIGIIILSQLAQGDKHGYEIKKNINLFMYRNKALNNNSLYPKLKQFQAAGFLTKTVEVQNGRPDRFMYSITKLGEAEFHKLLADLSPELVTADDEFYIRLSFFDLLQPGQQQRLLEYRKIYIQEQIQRMNQIIQTVGSSLKMPYSPMLSRYAMRQMECELELLNEMLADLSNNVNR